MSNEINKPSEPNYFMAYSDGVAHIGVTNPDQVTTTGQPGFIFSSDGAEFLAASKDVAMPDLPDLPQEGEWVALGVYQFEGKRLVCLQPHNRMHFHPDETPALFSIQQTGDGVLPWIANEQVTVGDLREYDGIVYIVIQSHTTQAGWQPPNVPALWQPI